MEERNQPVAIRVARPFDDEDALLAAEAGAFSRTGVVLIGAPSRPNGVVLRFELCLRDGTVSMRGEGRVVGYRAPTSQDEGALMLRFTRLDVKSKSLLDRALAIREERRSLAPPQPAAASPAPAAEEPDEAPPRSQPPRASASTASRVALPSVAPVIHAPTPAPAGTTMEVDDGDVEEVDDHDLRSADPGDLTEQVPEVAHEAEMDHEPVAVVADAPVVEPTAIAREEPVAARREVEPVAARGAGPRFAGLVRGRPFQASLDADSRAAALAKLRARRA